MMKRKFKVGARWLVAMLPTGLSRRLFLTQEYRRLPRLRKPRTFNEKVNWRIVFDRNPLLVVASSKTLSKEYVRSCNVNVKIPKTLWSGSTLDGLQGRSFDRDWIFKTSHKSGTAIFGAAGKVNTEDFPPLKVLLRDDEWINNRLWGYHLAPKEMLIEERIGAPGDVLNDYKFFVFDGDVKLVQVDYGRGSNHRRALYDPTWSLLPYVYTVPQAAYEPEPVEFGRMKEIAAVLGKDFDFVRVDLYLCDDGIYFGELTVYPAAGLSPWPAELDRLVGEFWQLPTDKS